MQKKYIYKYAGEKKGWDRNSGMSDSHVTERGSASTSTSASASMSASMSTNTCDHFENT